MRPEGFEIGVGQRARSLPSWPGAGVDQRARNVAGRRIRRGGREVAPAVVPRYRWQASGLPAQAEVQDQLGVDAPVVLDVSGEVRPLLADEADRVDLAAVGLAEQERGERIAAAVRWLVSPAAAGFRKAEAGAAGDALAAEAVVVGQLVHAAELERDAALDPGEVVVEA